MAKTVLLIDDSRTQLLNSRFALEKEGLKVETVSEPLKAIERICQVVPDLVVTDINMPEKVGLSIIEDLRNLPQFAKMPILVMSTDSQKNLLDKARNIGATGWLVKPVRREDLVLAVQRLLGLA
jgi:two-component system chemotaxis response regulator CheY